MISAAADKAGSTDKLTKMVYLGVTIDTPAGNLIALSKYDPPYRNGLRTYYFRASVRTTREGAVPRGLFMVTSDELSDNRSLFLDEMPTGSSPHTIARYGAQMPDERKIREDIMSALRVTP